jgi:hypothetical protein
MQEFNSAHANDVYGKMVSVNCFGDVPLHCAFLRSRVKYDTSAPFKELIWILLIDI